MFCPTRERVRDDPPLAAVVQEAQALLHRRSLVAAAAAAVPVPGLDWAVDALMVSDALPRINQMFGLTPQQIDALPSGQRERALKAITTIGTMLVGKFITRDLVLKAMAAFGVRMTAGQAARFIPIAGSVLSAGIGYATVRALGEAHIRDCLDVLQGAGLRPPARTGSPHAEPPRLSLARSLPSAPPPPSPAA